MLRRGHEWLLVAWEKSRTTFYPCRETRRVLEHPMLLASWETRLAAQGKAKPSTFRFRGIRSTWSP